MSRRLKSNEDRYLQTVLQALGVFAESKTVIQLLNMMSGYYHLVSKTAVHRTLQTIQAPCPTLMHDKYHACDDEYSMLLWLHQYTQMYFLRQQHESWYGIHQGINHFLEANREVVISFAMLCPFEQEQTQVWVGGGSRRNHLTQALTRQTLATQGQRLFKQALLIKSMPELYDYLDAFAKRVDRELPKLAEQFDLLHDDVDAQAAGYSHAR